MMLIRGICKDNVPAVPGPVHGQSESVMNDTLLLIGCKTVVVHSCRMVLQLGLVIMCISMAVVPAFAQTAEERALVERVFEKNQTPEDLLIELAFINDYEGNMATVQKLEMLQKYYTTHKAKNDARQGWCAAKIAQYELLKGHVLQCQQQCNRALQFLKFVPDPLSVDATSFYVSATKSLMPTLIALKRKPEAEQFREPLAMAQRQLGTAQTRELLHSAMEHVIRHDFESARSEAEQCVQLLPYYCLGYYVRAMVRFYSRETDKAAVDLNYAVQLSPRFPGALSLLARCQLIRKNYEQSIITVNRSIAAGADPEDTMLLRGIARFFTKDISGAADDLGVALKTRKSWAVAATRAECLGRLGRYEEASREYTRALAVEKATPQVTAELYFDRGVAYQCAGKSDLALLDMNKAIELDPKNKDLYKGRAQVRIRMGDRFGVSDFDEYSKLVILEQESQEALKKRERIPAVAESRPEKPSWILESTGAKPATSVASDSGADSKEERVADSSGIENRVEPKSQISASGEPAPPVMASPADSYLSYLEGKLKSELRAGTGAVERNVLRIEPDGVPTLEEQTESGAVLPGLVARCAPFRQPPFGKSAKIEVELDPRNAALRLHIKE